MRLLTKLTLIFLLIFTTVSCDNNTSPASVTSEKEITPTEREKGEGSPGGIPNLGATCYMNSVLQILKSFYLPKVNEKNDKLGKSLQVLMQLIADDKETANEAEATAVFKALHTEFGWTSDPTEQQDAQELINYFFNWMGLPTATTEIKFSEPTTRQERPSGTDDWLMYPVELPSNNDKSMQDFFNHSIAQETVMAKFRETDKGDSELHKQKKIKNLDKLYKQILVLQLKRFATKGGTKKLADGTFLQDFTKSKVEKKVETPMHLTIRKEQTIEKDKDRNYTLVGFIQHRGGVDSGHYVAYVKKDGRWICYNDEHVKQVSEAEAENNAQQAYLFFYQPNHLRRSE
jgi:ubiquitin C-terminal hydrolase